MRRFRLWLARKLVGSATFTPGATFTTTNGVVWTNGTASVPTVATIGEAFDIIVNNRFHEEDEMGKKKARSKAKGKAAAKNKQEQKSKAQGGKGAR